MVTTRQERIADIIKQRAPFLQDVQIKQNNLQKWVQALRELENIQAQIMGSGPPTMMERFKDFSFGALREKTEAAILDLEKPKRRFSRLTLNIGVIGRARQGKSRLLQSLSGLDSTVIPSGHLGHCTGVRSLILHHPNQQFAEIFFYKEQDFLAKVLTPYL